MRLANDLPEHLEYFQQRDDARGHPGFTLTQKITAALRQLAYGVGSDMWDEYLQMAKKTGRDSLNHFCKGVITLYNRRYLCKLTMYDIQRIYEVHSERHGFPGMLGSLDCMHVGWIMCPIAWRGQFHRGDHHGPTIVLEAVASQDLLAFFVNGEHFKYGYYLVDGIYSKWGTLVQAMRLHFLTNESTSRRDKNRPEKILKGSLES
ncbi:uncharacterized protein LOC143617995 [Bidens hawaiensis]|uniref:uncharacterized protein LOC143617995 n=1 Tax=Bidens hawaiensis TaxID=980011 RepID=UPI0040493E99